MIEHTNRSLDNSMQCFVLFMQVCCMPDETCAGQNVASSDLLVCSIVQLKESFYHQLSMPDNLHNKCVIVYAALLKANCHAYSKAICVSVLDSESFGDRIAISVSIEQECIEFGRKYLALSVYKDGKHLTSLISTCSPCLLYGVHHFQNKSLALYGCVNKYRIHTCMTELGEWCAEWSVQVNIDKCEVKGKEV